MPHVLRTHRTSIFYSSKCYFTGFSRGQLEVLHTGHCGGMHCLDAACHQDRPYLDPLLGKESFYRVVFMLVQGPAYRTLQDPVECSAWMPHVIKTDPILILFRAKSHSTGFRLCQFKVLHTGHCRTRWNAVPRCRIPSRQTLSPSSSRQRVIPPGSVHVSPTSCIQDTAEPEAGAK